jgi:hypothetical protein
MFAGTVESAAGTPNGYQRWPPECRLPFASTWAGTPSVPQLHSSVTDTQSGSESTWLCDAQHGLLAGPADVEAIGQVPYLNLVETPSRHLVVGEGGCDALVGDVDQNTQEDPGLAGHLKSCAE